MSVQKVTDHLARFGMADRVIAIEDGRIASDERRR